MMIRPYEIRSRLLRAGLVCLGLVWIASGAGKATQPALFLTSVYALVPRATVTSALALLLPPLEILLGFALVLQVRPRWGLLLSFSLLAIFTVVYAILFFAMGVEDCGCFGSLELLRLPPGFVFLRNILLLVLSWVLWRQTLEDRTRAGAVALLLCVGVAGALVTGYTAPRSLFVRESPWVGKALRETPLAAVATADSSQLIFLFSFTCSHCWDATENVKALLRAGVVNHVSAHGVGDGVQASRYEEAFSPAFTLMRYATWDSLRPLLGTARQLPVGYWIADDTVRACWEGSIPSPLTWASVQLSEK